MTTTLEEFSELAKEYTVIPVWKELVADYITPVAAFTRVVGDGHGFSSSPLSTENDGAGGLSLEEIRYLRLQKKWKY